MRVTTDELGGAGELARHTGVPSLVVADREAAIDAVGELLAYLPSSVDDDPPRWPTDDPVDRLCPEAGRPDPADVDRQLRRAPGRRGDRRRRQPARGPRPLGRQRRHGVRHDRRPPDRHRRQPADLARRHARHPGVAEGGPVRRRSATPSTCPIAHARRHARLLPGQGPRVAGHDPPRRPARVRLRPGDGAADLRDPAQELRRGVHRHGLQADGQRRAASPGRGPSWR